MTVPLTYKDVARVHDDMLLALAGVYEANEMVEELARQKVAYWDILSSVPDFKPGRSNLENDAKLRAVYPEFMDLLLEAEKQLRKAEYNYGLARENKSYNDVLISLAGVMEGT